MMFNRFTKGAGKVVTEAVDLAHELGATTVEAEHLLLAAVRRDDAARGVLRGARSRLRRLDAALTAETERSLAAVGVTATPPHFSPFSSKPRFATSAKVTLEGALKIAAERQDKQIVARPRGARRAAPRPRHGAPRAGAGGRGSERARCGDLQRDLGPSGGP